MDWLLYLFVFALGFVLGSITGNRFGTGLLAGVVGTILLLLGIS